MTLPGIPESATITALRRAVADYQNEHGVMGPAPDLIGAAAALIAEYDGQLAYIKAMTEQALYRDRPWVDPWSEQQASGGTARGTLDP